LGKLYYQKKELDKAVEAYNNAISASPNFVQPYYELSLIYLNDLKDFSKAESMVKKALELKPTDKDYTELYNSIKSKSKKARVN